MKEPPSSSSDVEWRNPGRNRYRSRAAAKGRSLIRISGIPRNGVDESGNQVAALPPKAVRSDVQVQVVQRRSRYKNGPGWRNPKDD